MLQLLGCWPDKVALGRSDGSMPGCLRLDAENVCVASTPTAKGQRGGNITPNNQPHSPIRGKKKELNVDRQKGTLPPGIETGSRGTTLDDKFTY